MCLPTHFHAPQRRTCSSKLDHAAQEECQSRTQIVLHVLNRTRSSGRHLVPLPGWFDTSHARVHWFFCILSISMLSLVSPLLQSDQSPLPQFGVDATTRTAFWLPIRVPTGGLYGCSNFLGR